MISLSQCIILLNNFTNSEMTDAVEMVNIEFSQSKLRIKEQNLV